MNTGKLNQFCNVTVQSMIVIVVSITHHINQFQQNNSSHCFIAMHVADIFEFWLLNSGSSAKIIKLYRFKKYP